MRALVVEDDRTTADLIALYLRREGCRVTVEHAGDRALERLEKEAFDLLVLDVMLPGADGLEICRRARDAAEADGPAILFVSARTAEEDRIAGLDLGADDYLVKPFSPRELAARARAILRRRPPGEEDRLVRGPLVLDRKRREVELDGRSVPLTASEFDLLEALARRPGHVRSRLELLDALSGERPDTMERTIDVHVRNLRRKIEADPAAPRLIETVVGIGYRFSREATP